MTSGANCFAPSPTEGVPKDCGRGAAFQAAGVAEALIRGYRLALPPTGWYPRMPARCRHSQGLGERGAEGVVSPLLRERSGVRESKKKPGVVAELPPSYHFKIYHYSIFYSVALTVRRYSRCRLFRMPERAVQPGANQVVDTLSRTTTGPGTGSVPTRAVRCSTGTGCSQPATNTDCPWGAETSPLTQLRISLGGAPVARTRTHRLTNSIGSVSRCP